MPAQITITEEQYRKILADADERTEMLTPDEIAIIATKLNEKVNVPIITERAEYTMLIKIVRDIDRFLYKLLPNEIYGLVRDSADGISEEEAENMSRRLAKLVNKYIDIPYIPEGIEEKIFQLGIGIIVDAMRKNFKLAA